MKESGGKSVTVKVPEVKLKLEDLTYLRSLSGDQKISCGVSERNINRLRILGLIEDREVPALPLRIAEAEKRIAAVTKELRRLLDTQDYKALGVFMSNSGYGVRNDVESMGPHKKTVLSEVGESLLKTGSVVTKVSKLGCL